MGVVSVGEVVSLTPLWSFPEWVAALPPVRCLAGIGGFRGPFCGRGPEFSPSSHLAYAWGRAPGRRQESLSLLPTPSQGPQNTFE